MTMAFCFPPQGCGDSIHAQGLLPPAWSLDLSRGVDVALLSCPRGPGRMRLSALIKRDCT